MVPVISDGQMNLIVRLHGTGKAKPILYLGHMDVVDARAQDWSLPPFKLTISREQWAQMVRLIAYPPPGVRGFEAYVGFSPEALALHRIDAVEAGAENEN